MSFNRLFETYRFSKQVLTETDLRTTLGESMYNTLSKYESDLASYQPVINTVAGTGVSGFSGDFNPGLATSAQLHFPFGVAVDLSGNILIADSSNNRIRRIVNGVITTIAGTGTAGFSGDGGSATSAQLASPYAVAVDLSGNILIADSLNGRIRRIVNGVITTIAGGGTSTDEGVVATSAQLGGLFAMAVDLSGNILISSNNRIRRIVNGVITTIAGGGTSTGNGVSATSVSLNDPRGIAVDLSGNILIADSSNNRIRRIVNGVITTIAGTGTRGLSGDGRDATSAQLSIPNGVRVDLSGNILIADSNNNCIRRIANGVITTVATITRPRGLAIDLSGNIIVADRDSHRISSVSSNGTITTIAGTGTAGFSENFNPGLATSAQLNSPHGIAVDLSGNILIADFSNNRIRRIVNGVITTIAGTGTAGFSGDGGSATSAQLNSPYAVAVDLSGNILIADHSNNRIRRIVNGIITTVSQLNNSVRSVSVDLSGNIIAISGNSILRFNNNSPTTLHDAGSSRFPQAMAVDLSGNIIFSIGNNIHRRNTDGSITTIAGTGTSGFLGDGGAATSAQLNSPFGVAVDSSGNIFVGDYFNSRIRRIANGVITTIAGGGRSTGEGVAATSAPLSGPRGLTIDLSGNILFADEGSHRIRRIQMTLSQPILSNSVLTQACQSMMTRLVQVYQNIYSENPTLSLGTPKTDTSNCGSTEVETLQSILTAFRTNISSIQATYRTTLNSLITQRITIPVDSILEDFIYNPLIEATTAPFLTPISAIPELTANTTTINGQTYTVTTSASAQNQSLSFGAFNVVSSNGWTKGTNETSPFIQLQISTPTIIKGYLLVNRSTSSFSYSTYTFQGSINGSSWITLDSANDLGYNSAVLRIIHFPTNTTAYSFYRFSATRVVNTQGTDVTSSSGIQTRLILYSDSAIQSTSQAQLLQIYNNYKNANERLQAIMLSSAFKTTYESARRFITDAELTSTTVTTRISIYTNIGIYTSDDITRGRRDILKTVVTKYGLVTNTDVSADAITDSTPIATLDTIQTNYLGTNALWPVYLNTLRTTVTTYINTIYKNARDAATTAGRLTQSSPNFVTDAVISRDAGYLDASKISSNVDVSGVVRYVIETSDRSGLTELVGYELYGEGSNGPLYTAPTTFNPNTNSTRHTFVSNNRTFIISTSPTSGWTGLSLRNTFTTTGSRPGGDVILQLPSIATISSVTFSTTCNSRCSVDLFGKNSENENWINISGATYDVASTTTFRTLNAGSSTPSFLYYQLTMRNVENLSRIMFTGIFQNSTLVSEYSLITQLYEKYKTYTNGIAAAVRQPAITNLSRFRSMYNSLTRCIPSDFFTNSAYAPMTAAVTSSALAPSLAPSSSTDEVAISNLTTASDIVPYITKYTTQLIELFKILRQNQIDTLDAYRKLYTTYVNFQANDMIRQYSQLTLLPTAEIPNNGSTDLSSMQQIPIPIASALPTDANITALAANCTLYNGPQGRFNLILMLIKSQLETFIAQYDVVYNSLPSTLKSQYPYTSPLNTLNQLPTNTTPQQLFDYMNQYAGFPADSLYTSLAPSMSPTVSLTGNTVSAAITSMRNFYIDTYIPCRRYLKSTQFTQSMQTAVTLCEKYLTTTGTLKTSPFILQSGDTLSGIIITTTNETISMIQALIKGYQTTYTEWIGRIPTLATTDPVPATLETDAVASTPALRGSYILRWVSLIAKIRNETTNVINSTRTLQIWRNSVASATVNVNGVSTKGLGNNPT